MLALSKVPLYLNTPSDSVYKEELIGEINNTKLMIIKKIRPFTKYIVVPYFLLVIYTKTIQYDTNSNLMNISIANCSLIAQKILNPAKTAKMKYPLIIKGNLNL